jgi:flagellin-like protein
MKNKAISPLIATVLLIAFVVSVAALVSIWLTGSVKFWTLLIGGRGEKEIICSHGGISLSGLGFCGSNLTGIVGNTGTIDLGDIVLYIIYTDHTSEKIEMCTIGNTIVNCTVSNLTLVPAEQHSFNLPIKGSNYDKIRVATNCSGVYDDVTSNEVVVC